MLSSETKCLASPNPSSCKMALFYFVHAPPPKTLAVPRWVQTTTNLSMHMHLSIDIHSKRILQLQHSLDLCWPMCVLCVWRSVLLSSFSGERRERDGQRMGHHGHVYASLKALRMGHMRSGAHVVFRHAKSDSAKRGKRGLLGFAHPNPANSQ